MFHWAVRPFFLWPFSVEVTMTRLVICSPSLFSTILFPFEVGLEGCGWKTACLLTWNELAKSLFLAVSMSSSQAGLWDFLCDWCPKFQTLLAHNPQNILGWRYPLLAGKITNTFPLIDVVL